ncbi:MAG: DUF3150 domain-containing protein [Verrucomicrobia bacterium]|nr:DUF3150 domain-containing protein [Verrucomicrobiota bacterium]
MDQLLQALTCNGVLINTSVRYWRGCKKLRPEDIGLQPGDLSDRLISLGHKRLLPKDATASLALIEGRAHALVEANTFPFLNGLAHFVPNTKLADVTGKLKELESEFWQAKATFIERYGALRESAAREWETLARKLVSDPERLVASIEAAFPPVGRMDRFFGFDIQLFQITVPERLGLDLLALGDQEQLIQARQQAAQEAGLKIRSEVEAFVADCVATLREQTSTLCQEMLESINTCETGVHQKTLNRLVNFIEQFKSMNFVNDQEMDQQLEAVRKELLTKTAEEYRYSSKARNQLVAGLSQLRDTAKRLATQDAVELVQRFGEMGRRRFHLAA